MYRIGEFSKMCRVTVKALRYYDEAGILKPTFVDAETSYRYYSSEQLIPAHRIVSLRQIGVSIDDIRAILEGAPVKSILIKRKTELGSEISRLTAEISSINHILKNKEEETIMDYQAVLKDLPEYIVYSKDTVIPEFKALPELIMDTQRKINQANPGLKLSSPVYCFVAYKDGEYKDKDIHIEYCEAVEEMGNETDGIVFKKLPSIKAVCVIHKGSYRRLGEAYAYAFKFVKENGYAAADYPRERYIDGMWNKGDNEEQWLTEIQIPVQK